MGQGKFRGCGIGKDRCTMCCTVHAVRELQKPEYTPCGACTGSGCMVWDTRPQSCREYFCEWARGWGDAEDRPDKLGVMFELWPERDSTGSMLLRSFELIPGAMFTPRAEIRRAQCVRDYNATEVAFCLDDNAEPLFTGPLVSAREENLEKPSGLQLKSGEFLDEPEELEIVEVPS